jgi:hypothetical protein
MKHFTHFSILVFIFVLNSLAACKTVRTSDKTVSESATASETASRRTFYRSIDSLSRQINLSADSISIIFSTEFPTAFPSEIEGCAETPSQTPRTPQSLKIYGLHLNKMIKEKSVDSADLNDSVNKFTQSQKLKSANKQKTVPATSPHHFVFYIYIILTFLIIVFLKKRFH